jgi:glycosyltransferase involved in cell wall biosynthesis
VTSGGVARAGLGAPGAEDDPETNLSDAAHSAPEVSVVMPCLNEAETVGVCIEKASRAMQDHGIVGEIIVADNGSSDDSRAIARRLGAVVVDVERKGYGNAMMAGIAAARGTFVIMGDADDSYDFGAVPEFVEKLRGGFDLDESVERTIEDYSALTNPVRNSRSLGHQTRQSPGRLHMEGTG